MPSASHTFSASIFTIVPPMSRGRVMFSLPTVSTGVSFSTKVMAKLKVIILLFSSLTRKRVVLKTSPTLFSPGIWNSSKLPSGAST